MGASDVISVAGLTQCYRVMAVDGDFVFASSGYSVLQIEGHTEAKRVRRFPVKVSFWKRILVKIRLFARFFRLGIRNIFILGDQILVIVDKNLYCLDTRNGSFVFKTRFMSGVPMNIAYHQSRGEYFYGSYETSHSTNEASIFSSQDLVIWERRYVFSSNSIRHVHGLYVHPEADLMVVATGDSDEQSKLLVSTDGCRTLSVLCGGNQYARVVSVVFESNENIIVATDGPDIQNYVYRISLSERDLVMTPSESWIPIAGPCFELTKADNGLYLSTVPEKSAVNQMRYAHVYFGETVADIRHVLSFERDFKFTEHFRPYFQHPNVQISVQENGDFVYLSGVALKNLDGKSLQLTKRTFVESDGENAKIYR